MGVMYRYSCLQGKKGRVRFRERSASDECPASPRSFPTQCEALFANKHKIILATDNDGPGEALALELARRLGRERCWRVKWPSAGASSACFLGTSYR